MKRKILFIDDQEEILDLIEVRLANEDYDKKFFTNIEDMMKELEKNDTDVVVTDIFMPGVGGIDVLEILKEKHPSVVRVVLSGFSQVNTVLAAINKGDVYRFITKPWRVDEEGKEILREALNYSDFLKGMYQKIEEDEKTDIKVLEQILQHKGIDYRIVASDSINETNTEKKVIELNSKKKIIL